MCVLFVSCRSPPRASTVQQAREQTERGPALSGCSCCLSLLLLLLLLLLLFVCLLLLLMCCRCFGNCQQEPCVSTPLLVLVEQPGRKKKSVCRPSSNLRGGLTSVVSTGLQAAHPAESCSSAFIRCAGCLSPISPRAAAWRI